MNDRTAAPDAWRVAYPNPADFNFDFAHLLQLTQRCGIARNVRSDLRIAVVGAGIAGLTAARELFRCGVTHIDIYEASARLGGRLRSQPVAGQHTVFELGAMRIPMFSRAQGPAAIFAQYAHAFGLTSQPFPTASSDRFSFGLYSERTGTFNLKPPNGALPLDPDVAEVRQKWQTFVSRTLAAIRASFDTPRWPALWRAIEQRYWRDSFRDVMYAPALHRYDPNEPGDLGGAGMSERQTGILERIGVGDGSWSAQLDISALMIFRLMLFGYFDDLHLIQGRFDPRGDFAGGPHSGDASLTDSLGHPLAAPRYLGVQSIADAMFFSPVHSEHVAPLSLYDALRDERCGVRLYTRSPVHQIARVPGGRMRLSCAAHERTYDAVLLTASMSGNRTAIRMHDFPETVLPGEVIDGDRMSHWMSVGKVYVALKERYWEKSNIPQLMAADNFLQQSYAYAVQTPRITDPGVLLLSYTWDAYANNLLGEPDDAALVSRCIDAVDRMLKRGGSLDRLSRYVDEHQFAVVQWIRQPTIRGAARVYRPGIERTNRALFTYNQNFSAESKLYLAGEAYAIDGGWVESALRVALDAVLHLLHNHQAEFADGFDFTRAYPRRDAVPLSHQN
ncbi:flavin monoamine oxidase family protein [Paraburkholderia humisilvae]|uniref:Tryptophan 2-monooxygenase n=1 Tax=Paraburkholderia humisilvae TaxID=627669 RepID=A0A6J5ED60_9BURK|nr:FAD-dependent oxidoreductase [Paraburkholderia humisilvae]CAB3763152.1 Tryptophan 2-monooxygenase [Paraburkholderia humisilvae]